MDGRLRPAPRWLAALVVVAAAAAAVQAWAAPKRPPLSPEQVRAVGDDLSRHLLGSGRLDRAGRPLLTFYVLGDSRAGGERDLLVTKVTRDVFDRKILGEIMERIVKDIEADRPAAPDAPCFVFHTGDITRRPDDEEDWERIRSGIAPLVTRDDLNVSVLPVIGNHEYHSTDASTSYKEELKYYYATFGGEIDGHPVIKDPVLRAQFNSEAPPRWYRVHCRNTDFIVLDSCERSLLTPASPATGSLPEQLYDLRRWLLEPPDGPVTNVFLMLHHPIFSNGMGHPDLERGSSRDLATGKTYRTTEMAQWIVRRRLLKQVLDEYYLARASEGSRVRATFHAHNHTYERIIIPPAHLPGWEKIEDLGAQYLTGPEGQGYADYVREALKLPEAISQPVSANGAFLDRDIRFMTSGGAGAPHRKKGGLLGGKDETHLPLAREQRDQAYANGQLERWVPDFYRYRYVRNPRDEYPEIANMARVLDGDFVPIARVGWVRRLQQMTNADVQGAEGALGIMPPAKWWELFSKKIPNDSEQYHFIKVRVYESAIAFDMYLKYAGTWLHVDHDEVTTGSPGHRVFVPGA